MGARLLDMIDREPVLDLLALLAQPPVGTSTIAKFRPRRSPLASGQHGRDLIYVSYAEGVTGKPPEKPLATRGPESPLLVPLWLQDPQIRLGVDAILHATFAMHVTYCSHCPSLQPGVYGRDFSPALGHVATQLLGRFLGHGLVLGIPLVFTYLLYSSLNRKGLRVKAGGERHIIKFPTSLSFITDPLALAFATESFLRRLQDGRRQVFPVSLPGRNLSIALPGEGTRALFRQSKEYVPVPGLFDALTVFFGLTAKDHAVFDHRHVTRFELHHSEGHRTNHVDPSRRIIEHQRRDFTSFLNGDSLKAIMKRFENNFCNELQGQLLDAPTTHIPDLYTFIRDSIFKAEVKALYGEMIFKICPSFCQDFWGFYDAFPVISRQLPRWLFPTKYQKRDKMLQNLHAWRIQCKAKHDSSDEGYLDCGEYEPVWGTLYIRRMVQRHEKLGFSDEGIASALLGYLFVTTANTIPAAAWMILHTLSDKSLTYRMRHEHSMDNLAHLDLPSLGSAPLLNSVYRETLRLHVAGATGRTSPQTGFGSHQAGTVTMTASWLGGLDTTFWNEGAVVDGVPKHPVDTFWAERFLNYPDDPGSGPLRKADIYPLADQFPIISDTKTTTDDSTATLSTSGLRGHWFPFGGGAWRCPGEALAKNTILVSVWSLLRDFDVHVTDRTAASKVVSEPRHRTLPFGTHAFSRLVPVDVTRRAPYIE
ncbi:25-hydroxycholesterol 7-alpha-hydroxylase [Colletotrichum viniferum]|nr:25-hydroxycholesterol 7-alpha-hydroxylase [Colletotrichum viniferum]